MKPYRVTVGAAVLAVALGSSPAWAQRPQSGDSGSRPSGDQSTGQTAVPRGGSGGSGSGGSSGGSASTPSGGSSSAPASVSSPSSGSRPASATPQRRGGGGQGVRAVPRGSSEGAPGSTADATSDDSATATPSSRAVPVYSRPRDGRAPVGTAVQRRGGVPPRGGTFIRPHYPFGYWLPAGYPYGMSYFYYDPFWHSGPGYGYQTGYAVTGPTGSLRLRIEPREAQVYVNGYYVGIVDDFDGIFQRLRIEPGGHRIEIRAEGYQPEQIDVLITAGETVTYRGELRPLP